MKIAIIQSHLKVWKLYSTFFKFKNTFKNVQKITTLSKEHTQNPKLAQYEIDKTYVLK